MRYFDGFGNDVTDEVDTLKEKITFLTRQVATLKWKIAGLEKKKRKTVKNVGYGLKQS